MFSWFSVVFSGLGLLLILSSYYGWGWLWRLGTGGSWLYKRAGHEHARFIYGMLGIYLVFFQIRTAYTSLSYRGFEPPLLAGGIIFIVAAIYTWKLIIVFINKIDKSTVSKQDGGNET